MRSLPRVLALVSVTLLPASAAAQQELDTVQIRTEQVGPGVYVLFGSGGNIGLAVGSDATFVVDDQFAPLTLKILAAIRAVTPNPVKFVVNTHWHFDHTGGNENLGNAGALIVAHENVRKRMTTGEFIRALNRTIPPAEPGALPVVTFTDAVTFHLNGDSLVVQHVAPAHTDGDAIIHFTKANVIHTGDVFHNAGLPFVDRSSGGSIHGIIAAADKIIAMSDGQTRIVPGHGVVSTREDVMEFRDMVLDVKAEVAAMVARGMTYEQVAAASPTAPYEAKWGDPERFLTAVYAELGGEG